jgi:hypothetical protein
MRDTGEEVDDEHPIELILAKVRQAGPSPAAMSSSVLEWPTASTRPPI